MLYLSSFITLLVCFPVVYSIFKEQEGEYNWRKSLVGVVSQSSFKTSYLHPSSHAMLNASHSLSHDMLDSASHVDSVLLTVSYDHLLLSAIDTKDGSLRWRLPYPDGHKIISHAVIVDITLVMVSDDASSSCSVSSISSTGTTVWEMDIDRCYCMQDNAATAFMPSGTIISGNRKRYDDVTVIFSSSKILILSDIDTTRPFSNEHNVKDMRNYNKYLTDDQNLVWMSISIDKHVIGKVSESKIIAYGCAVSPNDKDELCSKIILVQVGKGTNSIDTHAYNVAPAPMHHITPALVMKSDVALYSGKFITTSVVADGVKVDILDLEWNAVSSATYAINLPDKYATVIDVILDKSSSNTAVPLLSICGDRLGCELVRVTASQTSPSSNGISSITFTAIHHTNLPANANAELCERAVMYQDHTNTNHELYDLSTGRKFVNPLPVQGRLVHSNCDPVTGRYLLQYAQGTMLLVDPVSHHVIWRREEAVSYAEQVVLVGKIDSSISAVEGGDLNHLAELVTEPTILHRLDLQRIELQTWVSSWQSFSMRDVVDIAMKALFNYVPIHRANDTSDMTSSSKKNLLESELHSNKIAVMLCKISFTDMMIVLVGMDVASGEVAWLFSLPTSSSNSISYTKLLLTRQAAAAQPAEVTLVVQGEQALTYRFNTLSGKLLSSSSISQADDGWEIKDVLVAPEHSTRTHELSYLMLMEESSSHRVKLVEYPATGLDHRQHQPQQTYFHTVDEESGRVNCYVNAHAGVRVVGSVLFPTRSERIVAFFYPTEDFSRSKHTLLGDDSILLKYRNPNLLIIASVHPPEAAADYFNPSSQASSNNEESDAQSTLTLTSIDTVSGRILHRIRHVNGASPVHGTFVDGGSFVVSYWNCKAKRTELSSVSLYEGLVDKYSLNPFATPATSTTMQQLERNSNHSSFSSSSPLVMQRTYWLPKVTITGLHTTVTAASITNKNIIATTNTGQLLMLDMRQVNARRPIEAATAAEKEEGLQPYHPLILLNPAQSYLTLQQGLYHSSKQIVACAPTSLESTVAVMSIFGPDIYFNVAKPSQSFDSLASDFNYMLLLSILIFLAVVVVIMRRQVKRKKLNATWL